MYDDWGVESSAGSKPESSVSMGRSAAAVAKEMYGKKKKKTVLKHQVYEGKAFGVLGTESAFRTLCYRIAMSKWLDKLMSVIIIGASLVIPRAGHGRPRVKAEVARARRVLLPMGPSHSLTWLFALSKFSLSPRRVVLCSELCHDDAGEALSRRGRGHVRRAVLERRRLHGNLQ